MLNIGSSILYFLYIIFIISCLYSCIIEPHLKLRARFGECKTGLSTRVILYFCSFQGDTSDVVLFASRFGVKFLCCLSLMCVFIFLLGWGN